LIGIHIQITNIYDWWYFNEIDKKDTKIHVIA